MGARAHAHTHCVDAALLRGHFQSLGYGSFLFCFLSGFYKPLALAGWPCPVRIRAVGNACFAENWSHSRLGGCEQTKCLDYYKR